MVLDFALLTERQGEILDQIEFQVKNAADHVEDGNVEISTAIEYQKLVRKKQWYAQRNSFDLVCLPNWISLCDFARLCCSWIILIIVIVLSILLYLFFGKK